MTNPLTKMSFTAAGAALGIVSTGISYFLLMYYNQVLGLSPSLTGLAMMIALVVDAVSDPLVGRWSDRVKHRLGRRHPFLFLSTVPVAITFYFLWAVPEAIRADQGSLFVYLVGLIISLRICLTMYAVPFSALTPELAPGYEDRTTLLNYQNSSGWFVGALFMVLMYAIWLADTPEYPDGMGILRADGYVEAALVESVFLIILLGFAAWGTARYIPQLASPPDRAGSLFRMFEESVETLKDRNFLAMAFSGILGAAAAGIGTSLWVYLQSYFWMMDAEQISTLLMVTIIASITAFITVPIVTRGRDKKPVLIITSVISLLVALVPIFLMTQGMFFERGSDEMFYALLVREIFWSTTLVMGGTLTSSLMADIVDARAAETGRREEGLVFSVQSFVGKCASGIGIFSAGIALALINFPAETDPASIPVEITNNLGYIYILALVLFSGTSIAALVAVQLDRKEHEANLERLRAG